MSKYNITFIYNNKHNYENFVFYNNNNKKISDIKEFINSFDNSVCPCMLIVKINKTNFLTFKTEEYAEDKIKLKLIPENSTIVVEQKNNKCTCGFLSKNNEKLLLLTKKALINKINDLIHNKNNEKLIDFYDIIININSLINIKKGWQIKFSKNGLNKFNLLKNKKFGVIGLIGNGSNGKSFILSKLIGRKISPEESINSDGLCIKYLDIEENFNQQYIFLDTKGLNEPILGTIKDYNDITAKNLFLQNFIIFYSDILLLVIDYLSFSEQKLINQIKNNIKRGNKFKKLFIIHNLKTYTNKKDIKYYINNILLKSYSFKLRKNETVTSKKENIIKGEYFTEPFGKNLSVFHLIFAKDQSDGGNYYNDFCIYFIQTHFYDIIDFKNFDIIENIKSNFSLQSKIYFDNIIKNDDFWSANEMINKKLICLNKSKNLTLKKNLFEDLGLQVLEDNYFEPKYSIVKTKKYLEIIIELPGNIKVDIFRPKFFYNFTSINIIGNKYRDNSPKEKNNNIIDIRNYGEFNLKINFETQDYKINPNIIYKKFDGGLLILRYDFEEEKIPEKITLSINEEI